MTLDILLECTAAELEAMTDQQLLVYFEPYLTACRPVKESTAQSIGKEKLRASVGIEGRRQKTMEDARRLVEQFKLNLPK